MFKKKVNARTDDDGHRAMTLARWPTASGAKTWQKIKMKCVITKTGRNTDDMGYKLVEIEMKWVLN